MNDWYEMTHMTSAEFAAVRENIKIGLIPVGATEQHGPNLALSTDFMVGHRLAQKLAQRLHPRAAVAPPLPFGLSYHHNAFAGTMTLSPESFIAVCVDIARSFQRNGLNHVLFMNGHNGNTAILNVICQKLVYELNMKAAASFYYDQAMDVIKQHSKSERWGHACEIETSVLLALAPELVRTDALTAGKMKTPALKHAFFNQPFTLQVPVPFHEQTENGAFGDARLASREIGEAIVETALERIQAFVESFLETYPK